MKYKMDDGRIVDIEKAQKSWKESTYWDGHNNISVNTNSQWEHQELYLSQKGNYYLEIWSQWQGSQPYAIWVSEKEAAEWLVLNNESLPEGLKKYLNEIEE